MGREHGRLAAQTFLALDEASASRTSERKLAQMRAAGSCSSRAAANIMKVQLVNEDQLEASPTKISPNRSHEAFAHLGARRHRRELPYSGGHPARYAVNFETYTNGATSYTLRSNILYPAFTPGLSDTRSNQLCKDIPFK